MKHACGNKYIDNGYILNTKVTKNVQRNKHTSVMQQERKKKEFKNGITTIAIEHNNT